MRLSLGVHGHVLDDRVAHTPNSQRDERLRLGQGLRTTDNPHVTNPTEAVENCASSSPQELGGCPRTRAPENRPVIVPDRRLYG